MQLSEWAIARPQPIERKGRKAARTSSVSFALPTCFARGMCCNVLMLCNLPHVFIDLFINMHPLLHIRRLQAAVTKSSSVTTSIIKKASQGNSIW